MDKNISIVSIFKNGVIINNYIHNYIAGNL